MVICHREIMTGIGLVDIKVPKTCVSRTTILTMVYKLVLSAEKKAGENYVDLGD
jgi:hypothetical protein